MLALLQEVAQVPEEKINWNALVKKTSTGISNPREYQMIWRHLAYRDSLVERLDDGSEPLVSLTLYFILAYFILHPFRDTFLKL